MGRRHSAWCHKRGGAHWVLAAPLSRSELVSSVQLAQHRHRGAAATRGVVSDMFTSMTQASSGPMLIA